MTVKDALRIVDDLMPNQYSREQKTGWLKELDGILYTEIIKAREGWESVQLWDDKNENAVLLAPQPYDHMYISFLESRIHYANAEYGKYNNANMMFDSELAAYRNWYNRENMPARVTITYF